MTTDNMIKNKKREVYLDYLRMFSTFAILLAHTVSLASSLLEEKNAAWITLETIHFVSVGCNLIFIMISGALLLNVHGEKISKFYQKRFLRVFLPLVVCYVCYICAANGFVWLHPRNWWSLIKMIFSGAPEEAPHFWLIYVIIWLYVFTPAIRIFLEHISDFAFKIVLLFILIVNTLYTFVPQVNGSAIISKIVSSFIGVFLLGYFLNKKQNVWLERILMGCGIVSFFIGVYFIVNVEQYKLYIFNNSPIMMFFAAAMFLFVKKCCSSKKSFYFMDLVNKHSYTVLLLHWGMLHFLVKQVLGISVLSGGIWGGCILTFLLTFVFSLIGAIVLDNTIFHWLNHIVTKFFNLFVKKDKA